MGMQQDIYQQWKNDRKVGTEQAAGLDVDKAYGNQCVDVMLDLTQYYFPNENYRTTVPVMGSAKYAADKRNDKFYEWIPNNHSDPNQLPQQGDFLVCDQTPQAGYTNQTVNKDGHLGAVDHADKNGYTLAMQDGSTGVAKVILQTRPWKFRPVIGWLRPRLSAQPAPIEQPKPTPPVATPPTLSRSNIGKRFYLPLVTGYPAYKPGTRTVRARLDAKNIASARSYIIRDIDTVPNQVLVNSAQFGTLALSTDDGGTIK
jgi:hypothetical protein